MRPTTHPQSKKAGKMNYDVFIGQEEVGRQTQAHNIKCRHICRVTVLQTCVCIELCINFVHVHMTRRHMYYAQTKMKSGSSERLIEQQCETKMMV